MWFKSIPAIKWFPALSVLAKIFKLILQFDLCCTNFLLVTLLIDLISTKNSSRGPQDPL